MARVHSAPPSQRNPHANSPQSTPSSAPLRTPSLQVGESHVPEVALHTPLEQSEAREHSTPESQEAGQGPPQSTPASRMPPGLFRTLSLHVAAMHTPYASTPETQFDADQPDG